MCMGVPERTLDGGHGCRRSPPHVLRSEMWNAEEVGAIDDRSIETGRLVVASNDPPTSPIVTFSTTAKEGRVVAMVENQGVSTVTVANGAGHEGHQGFQSSFWGHKSLEESVGEAPTPATPGAPTEGQLVRVPGIEPRPSKECFILAHQHSHLVTLHAVECLGAELGLLVRVGQSEVETLVTDVCELAGVPSVTVEFVRAPNRKHRKYLGWYCGYTSLPLFEYSERIVLNGANGGDTLIVLAHELAHHVVEVRRIRKSVPRPTRRHRSHARPFPETYREMVGYVHAQVAGRLEAPNDTYMGFFPSNNK